MYRSKFNFVLFLVLVPLLIFVNTSYIYSQGAPSINDSVKPVDQKTGTTINEQQENVDAELKNENALENTESLVEDSQEAEEFSKDSVKVSLILGKAEYSEFGKRWKKLNMGMILKQGTIVRTKNGSTVELKTTVGDIIHLAPQTVFKLETGKDTTVKKFKLLMGKVWANVKKLNNKTRFMIKTPTAVAGVRGTVFTLVFNEKEGTTSLYVSEGEVAIGEDEFKLEVSVSDNMMSQIFKSGDITEPRKITEKDLKQIIKGMSFMKNKKDNPKFNQMRDDIRGEVDSEKMDIALNNEITSEKLYDDIATGRTVIDRHGDITRVDQYYKRTDANSLQVVNLSSRETGHNKGLSYVDMSFRYKSALPADINGFIDTVASTDKGKLDYRTVIIGHKLAGKRREELKYELDVDNDTEKISALINKTVVAVYTENGPVNYTLDDFNEATSQMVHLLDGEGGSVRLDADDADAFSNGSFSISSFLDIAIEIEIDFYDANNNIKFDTIDVVIIPDIFMKILMDTII